jgi:DUF971 family protein
MRLLWIFAILFMGGYIFTASWAVEPAPINEMEALLKKIQHNTKAVGQATQAAREVSEKLVEAKVEEKEELKEAVIVAEAKVEKVQEVIQKMEEKVEFYTVKMIGNGVDTSFQEVSFSGPVYEAYLNYLEEGGKEDFDYFRMYLWQQK